VTSLADHAAGHDDAVVANAAALLLQAHDALSTSTDWLLSRAAESQEDVLAGASPYLRQFGNVAGGFYLLRGVLSALAADGDVTGRELEYRRALLGFYAENVLTEAIGLTRAVTAGRGSIVRIDPEAFGG
jgi:hypothetical protein